ncbi:hypothetical protein WJX74_005233 [Apatococcus lobatus]|uniref:Uncharacterized protein n=1 Tax=Apatococcus lobatus TaxID=904363 RepID=A0AAW1RSN6_9CHLO
MEQEWPAATQTPACRRVLQRHHERVAQIVASQWRRFVTRQQLARQAECKDRPGSSSQATSLTAAVSAIESTASLAEHTEQLGRTLGMIHSSTAAAAADHQLIQQSSKKVPGDMPVRHPLTPLNSAVQASQIGSHARRKAEIVTAAKPQQSQQKQISCSPCKLDHSAAAKHRTPAAEARSAPAHHQRQSADIHPPWAFGTRPGAPTQSSTARADKDMSTPVRKRTPAAAVATTPAGRLSSPHVSANAAATNAHNQHQQSSKAAAGTAPQPGVQDSEQREEQQASHPAAHGFKQQQASMNAAQLGCLDKMQHSSCTSDAKLELDASKQQSKKQCRHANMVSAHSTSATCGQRGRSSQHSQAASGPVMKRKVFMSAKILVTPASSAAVGCPSPGSAAVAAAAAASLRIMVHALNPPVTPHDSNNIGTKLEQPLLISLPGSPSMTLPGVAQADTACESDSHIAPIQGLTRPLTKQGRVVDLPAPAADGCDTSSARLPSAGAALVDGTKLSSLVYAAPCQEATADKQTKQNNSLWRAARLPTASLREPAPSTSVPQEKQTWQQQAGVSLTAMLEQPCAPWPRASSFEAGPPSVTGRLMPPKSRKDALADRELLAKGLRGLVEALLRGRQQQHDASVLLSRQSFLRLAGALQGWQAYKTGRKQKAAHQQRAWAHLAQRSVQEAVLAWQTYVVCRGSKKCAAMRAKQHRQQVILASILPRWHAAAQRVRHHKWLLRDQHERRKYQILGRAWLCWEVHVTSRRQKHIRLQQAHGLARCSLKSSALAGWREGIHVTKQAAERAGRAMHNVAVGMQRSLQSAIVARWCAEAKLRRHLEAAACRAKSPARRLHLIHPWQEWMRARQLTLAKQGESLRQKVLGRCSLHFWLAAARWRRLRRAQFQEATSRLQAAILRRFLSLWEQGCQQLQSADRRKALATRHCTNAALAVSWRAWTQYTHARRFKTDLLQASDLHHGVCLSAAAWSAWMMVIQRKHKRAPAEAARPRWLLTRCLLRWQLHAAQKLARAVLVKQAGRHRRSWTLKAAWQRWYMWQHTKQARHGKQALAEAWHKQHAMRRALMAWTGHVLLYTTTKALLLSAGGPTQHSDLALKQMSWHHQAKLMSLVKARSYHRRSLISKTCTALMEHTTLCEESGAWWTPSSPGEARQLRDSTQTFQSWHCCVLHRQGQRQKVAQSLRAQRHRCCQGAWQQWQAYIQRGRWKLAAAKAAHSYHSTCCCQLAVRAWLSAVLHRRCKLRKQTSAHRHRRACLLRRAMRDWRSHHGEQNSRRAELAAAQAVYENAMTSKAAGVHLSKQALGQNIHLQHQSLNRSSCPQEILDHADSYDNPLGQRPGSWAHQNVAPASCGNSCKTPFPAPVLPQMMFSQASSPAAYQHGAGHAAQTRYTACMGAAWDLQQHISAKAALRSHRTWQQNPCSVSEVLGRISTDSGMWPGQDKQGVVPQKPSALLQRLADLKLAADAALQSSHVVQHV